jgi:pyruvate dehydrogenase E2 component (dihydrolipoamide acetyltransferase)
MIFEVVMPQLGADMIEGTILRWRKREGEPVERGEVIVDIETDKANVEIEAFAGGVFRTVLASEGETIPIGGVIAIIAGAEDDISAYAAGTKGQPPATADARIAPTSRTGAQTATESERQRVSPVARRIADELGVDLRNVRGTGPDGRIVRRDIEAAASTPLESRPTAEPPPPRPGTSRMRQAIARRMSRSKQEAPHYYLVVDIDMTEAQAFRARTNAGMPDEERISINDILVRACALALRVHPDFNVTIDGDETTQHDVQNVCIAVALDEGLNAPAILDAGAKPLATIARETKDLIGRAKGGALRPEEITAGTFCITNLGAFGIEALIGIIQPPQTAILGVGSVTPNPAVRAGEIVARDLMKVALSADHRVTDGAQGAQFLAEIKRLLEQPRLLGM